MAARVEVGENLSGNFHENDLLFDAGGEHLATFEVFGLYARLNQEQSLALDGLGIGWARRDAHQFGARLLNEQEGSGHLEIFHGRPRQRRQLG